MIIADDIEAVARKMELDRPILLGHSMGGMVAQVLLRRSPSAYRGAILCATSPAFGQSEGEFQRRFVAAQLTPLDAGVTMSELAENSFDRVAGPEGAENPYRSPVSTFASTPNSTYRAAVQCLTTFNEKANLSTIGVPVLCLAGELVI